MYQVFFNNKVVFESYEEAEIEEYCNKHPDEWDYTQDTSYAEFERACGIYY